MNCTLNVAAVIATWDEGEVKILVKDEVGHLSLPELAIADAKRKPDAYLDKLLAKLTSNQSRIFHTNLPLTTETCTSDSFIAYAPYLVLCPRDVIEADGFHLVALSTAQSQAMGRDALYDMLEAATSHLTNLIGTSTACLNMLPRFFTTVDIHRIHNAVLGGEVNRMTLRKRYVDTDFIASTDERVTVKAGRQPKEMYATINHVHIFGVMLSVSDS